MDVKQAVLLVFFALFSRNIHLSHQTTLSQTNAYSSHITSPADASSASVVNQQPVAGPAIDVSGASRSEASETGASSSPNFGWHLGGRPISAPDHGSQRHRRHVDGILTGADDARSSRRRRQLLQQQQQALGGHRQSWTNKGAAKRIKHEWDDSVLAWIKRSNEEGQRKPSELADLKLFGGATSGSRGVEATGTKSSGAVFADEQKRRWDEADLTWIKRTPHHGHAVAADDDDDGYELVPKRNWDDSVLTWIKRRGGIVGARGVEAAAGRKPQGGGALERPLVPFYHDKRLWDDHEMTWLKRDAK